MTISLLLSMWPNVGQISHFLDKMNLARPPGHGTPCADSGTITAITGRLASLSRIPWRARNARHFPLPTL